MQMKELVSFITQIQNMVKSNANVRLVYYIFITLALLAVFLMLPESEIGFIYNDF